MDITENQITIGGTYKVAAVTLRLPGPILVGESNPYGADPSMALYPLPPNSAGGRMQRLVLGIRRWRYVELERHNLCADNWSMPEARERARELMCDCDVAQSVFLLLGRKVAAAFGQAAQPVFSAVEAARPMDPLTMFVVDTDELLQTGRVHHRLWLVLLPHPSGLNRMWADRTTVHRCRELIQARCPDLPLGEVDDG